MSRPFNLALKFADLRAMPTEEIVSLYDKFHNAATAVRPEYYLTEIARRDAFAQSDRIEAMTQQMATLTTDVAAMTKTIKTLTWVIAGLTLVNAAAAVIATVLLIRG